MGTTENNLPVQALQMLPVSAIKERVAAIQQIMRDGMVEGQDYGKIPGCGPKPTLLKPGSEKILFTFRLAPDPLVEDLSTQDTYRYRVTVKLYEIDSGKFLGAGVGEASTDEEKYAWRKAICDEEFDATPESRRRIKFGVNRSTGEIYQAKQVRTNPADSANTVLKMSKKRAIIDATLTVTAASEVFTQDLEEIAEYQSRGFTDTQTPKNPGDIVLGFGKHKGKRLSDVPEDYLDWLAGNANDEGLRQAVIKFLQVPEEAGAEVNGESVPLDTGDDIPSEYQGSIDDIPF